MAEPVRGLRGQKFSVDRVCPTFIKFTFLKSSRNIARNIHHPASSEEIFLKVSTPNGHRAFTSNETRHKISLDYMHFDT